MVNELFSIELLLFLKTFKKSLPWKQFHGSDQNKIYMIAWEKLALLTNKGCMGISSFNQIYLFC